MGERKNLQQLLQLHRDSRQRRASVPGGTRAEEILHSLFAISVAEPTTVMSKSWQRAIVGADEAVTGRNCLVRVGRRRTDSAAVKPVGEPRGMQLDFRLQAMSAIANMAGAPLPARSAVHSTHRRMSMCITR